MFYNWIKPGNSISGITGAQKECGEQFLPFKQNYILKMLFIFALKVIYFENIHA